MPFSIHCVPRHKGEGELHVRTINVFAAALNAPGCRAPSRVLSSTR